MTMMIILCFENNYLGEEVKNLWKRILKNEECVCFKWFCCFLLSLSIFPFPTDVKSSGQLIWIIFLKDHFSVKTSRTSKTFPRRQNIDNCSNIWIVFAFKSQNTYALTSHIFPLLLRNIDFVHFFSGYSTLSSFLIKIFSTFQPVVRRK
jgi:hypothetical protein